MNKGSGSRVAIVGARGIGKHHAKWWTVEGADVCAIVGSSEATAREAGQALHESIEFGGNTYASLEAMIEAEHPDIVDVCSPAPQHAEHVRTALDRGCHVLCEKPFVYAPGKSRDALLAEAEALIDLAHDKHRRLGVCLQYAFAAPAIKRDWRDTYGAAPVTRFTAHFETPSKGRDPDPERIWMDLAPHPLSLLYRLKPVAGMFVANAETDFDGNRASASFTLRSDQEAEIACQIHVSNSNDANAHRREFILNDHAVTFSPSEDERGHYCTRVVTPHSEWCHIDLLRHLIRAFCWSETVQTVDEIVTNLDWTLALLEQGHASMQGAPG